MNAAKLRRLLDQAVLSSRACIKAMENGDRKHAVTLQLAAIEAIDSWNDELLKQLETMRKVESGEMRKTWAP